jgi:pimeloyl-ACP methyl ester carboxylesterase
MRAVLRSDSTPYLTTALAGTAALLASAVLNRYLARRAERDNPPKGGFVTVDGLDVHYIVRGEGRPLVLLHGNGSMLEDFASSGLMEAAAADHRVIAIDRPGFGHTKRPSDSTWGPEEQADLIKTVLDRLEVTDAIVLGHSWGTSVAIALGLRHPSVVGGLVLVSGYYFPTFRPDFFMIGAPAMPFFGNIMSQTIAPLISRAMWPALLAKIFGPAKVPVKFAGFPEGMAVRPSQIQAAAEESTLLIPSVAYLKNHYAELKMPVTIIAGDQDRLIDPASQSERLHGQISQSRYIVIPGQGHMVHQTATPIVAEAVASIDKP